MQLIMRRLHPRGAANRGICVDAEGATLGPDCVLVRRTSRGFRGIERDRADALQKCALAGGRDRDLLFRQSQRIAEALDKGEIALAQIYGLHIPVVDLNDRQLARISQIGFARGYNPDEPRLPKGDPHGGEWTIGETADAAVDALDVFADIGDGGGDDGNTGGGDDGEGGGDSGDGGSDGDGGTSPPATGEGPSVSIEATTATGNQDNGGDTPPADEPPMEFKWPDASPPAGAPPAQPVSADGGPATLGTSDLGDETPNPGPQPGDGQPSPQDDAASPSGTEGNASPPDIPATQPSTTQQVNAVLRSLATWLGLAQAVLGAVYESDPEVAMVLAAIEATIWLADYISKIFSYLDGPQTVADLQSAATRPAPPGYEIHHIVEAQRGSDNPQSNARNFPDLIDSAENLVRIPYWKHVEISSWYSTKNERYGGVTPRQYLRGKSWNEQYTLGLQILRDMGVLK
jgi:hypothetical protein